MSSPIEDYAVIGDCHTAALVARDGSIDWLCFPRFDSGACFAALLGSEENGRWLLSPANKIHSVRRRYREDTLVLETDYETEDGAVTLIDCMPPRSKEPDVVRMVVGRRGHVCMRLRLTIRFDYGSIVPWVRRTHKGIRAIAGPDTLVLQTNVDLRGEGLTTIAEFTVSEGERVPFVLLWHPSHEHTPSIDDPQDTIVHTERWWREWSSRCTYEGPWRANVLRSLITLKARTYEPTGGLVASPTTSLPEQLGGTRNWDYRYCWLRDATLALLALMNAGFYDEATAWRDWLLRAVAGNPDQMQIMYGLGGERRLVEWEVPWLAGYQGAKPVRVGNAAHGQLQLDVYGELMDTIHHARRGGLAGTESGWAMQRALLRHLESIWQEPDESIWEIRGPRQPFTYSKVMAWVAFDRAVKSVEQFGLEGPVDRWRALRSRIHAEICEKGFDRRR